MTADVSVVGIGGLQRHQRCLNARSSLSEAYLLLADCRIQSVEQVKKMPAALRRCAAATS